MKKAKISHNVILRLPRYLRFLEDLKDSSVVRISSGELGRLMGITASQIRQDFSCFGEFGQQGYGYNVEMLMKEIGEILGIDKGRTAIVIGTGNLGRAIIGKFPFDSFGVTLTGIFDVAPDLVGSDVFGRTVRHSDTIEDFVRENNTDIAILTMPGSFAKTVAGRLSDAGIKGIWNFTHADLKSTGNVRVQSVHFSDSLLVLNYYLSNENLEEPDKN